MYSPETLAWIHRVVATSTPGGPQSALQGSMPMLLGEMDEAGITIGVAQGRHARRLLDGGDVSGGHEQRAEATPGVIRTT